MMRIKRTTQGRGRPFRGDLKGRLCALVVKSGPPLCSKGRGERFERVGWQTQEEDAPREREKGTKNSEKRE